VTQIFNWLSLPPTTYLSPTNATGGTSLEQCNWLDNLSNGVELDEVECIASNLIYTNKIKGYVSHQKNILVLSKVDPFPTSAVITGSLLPPAGISTTVFNVKK
jgi:hypothetical protein